MNMINVKEISWKPDSLEDVEKASSAIAVKETVPSAAPVEETSTTGTSSMMQKFKSKVRELVDCCIE